MHLQKEPAGGCAELMYTSLSKRRRNSGAPYYTFWDKKCLNPGQNWKVDFLYGICTSSVIILLISAKVCSYFFVFYEILTGIIIGY